MKPFKYMVLSGIALVIAGGGSATWGALSWIKFWKESGGAEHLSIGQLARGMIIPHIFMFLGTGIVVFGLILIVRGIIFRVREQKEMRT